MKIEYYFNWLFGKCQLKLTNIGFNTLELIQKYKKDNNISCKVSFAGRLDPAYGLMILLEGEECKKQDIYVGRIRYMNLK